MRPRARTRPQVRLLFSVNQSGHFLGYAVMCTPVGKYTPIVWSNGKAFGNAFGIEWRCLYNLGYQVGGAALLRHGAGHSGTRQMLFEDVV